MPQARRLLQIAQRTVADHPRFFMIQGPGVGDRANLSFMKDLRIRAEKAFGHDFSEKKICGKNNYAVDFYFPREATIVEVALGLRNPRTEFETDVLKAIMAKEVGHRVRHLVFISKLGAEKKCRQPGRMAIRAWAKRNHDIAIAVHDLRDAT